MLDLLTNVLVPSIPPRISLWSNQTSMPTRAAPCRYGRPLSGFTHTGRFLPVDVLKRGNTVTLMAKVLSEITRDALELSPAQRRTLARILLEVSDDSLDFSPELEAVWDEEIVRRLQTVEAGTAKARSAEEVFAELDRRFPR